MYLISQARAGSLAFGATIDGRFPPSAPYFSFCPCCNERESDTLTHHLLGRCATTQHIAQSICPALLETMRSAAPEWMEDYEEYTKGQQNADCAALILAAGDEEFEDATHKIYVVKLLASWLRQIVDLHPLCERQRKGEHFSQLRYLPLLP
jgi:hypothetical protein